MRVRATSPTIFEEKCMHCGSAEELFHELSTLQEELMTEALEARQGGDFPADPPGKAVCSQTLCGKYYIGRSM